MEPYRYRALAEGADEIRLVYLHHGKNKDEIIISLQHSSFPRNSSCAPNFEALSYVWGSDSKAENISITDPNTDERSISITQNLASALPYLRYEDRDRVLWIDAICS